MNDRLAALPSLLERAATPVAQLVTRLAFGQAFALTGWGKLGNLPGTVQFFESLGIPAANLQAPMVATVEFVGGLLLLLGFGTRIAATLLAGTMLVALATAHGDDLLAGLRLQQGFDAAAPVPFLVAATWLAAKGAGRFSLDAQIAKSRGA